MFDVPVQLELGGLSAEVSVTATRAERETRQIPLHVRHHHQGADRTDQPAVDRRRARRWPPTSRRSATAPSACARGCAGSTPRGCSCSWTASGSTPRGRRPTARARKSGSSRPDAISRMEIVNGAGTLLYGSDALAGTINIITNEPSFSDRPRWLYGFNGFYSTNEHGAARHGDGRRDGAALRRPRCRRGRSRSTTTRPAASASKTRGRSSPPARSTGPTRSTTTSASPSTRFPIRSTRRTSARATRSRARARRAISSTCRASFKLGERRTLRVRYQRRRMDDVGFPDFAPPYFFNATSLPHSDLDRVSARYEAQAVTPWLANLSLTAHYQRTERLLQNLLPVQFPAPTRRRLLPDQRLPARHPVRDRTARLDARRRPAGRDRAGREPRADDRASRSIATAAATSARRRPPRRWSARWCSASAVPRPVVFPVAGAARPALGGASGSRARCEPARRRAVRAGRMAAPAEPVARRRAARRLLQRHDRGHAGLRRRVGRRRRACRRSIPPRCPTPTAPPTPGRR